MKINPQNFYRKYLKYPIYIAVVLIIALGSYFRLLDRYELQTADLRFKLRPIQEYTEDIIIIEIANDTIEALGTWPIDREYHAYLIDILKIAKAKNIIFDVMFSESSLSNNAGENLDSTSDETFKESLKDSPNVILPVVLDYKYENQKYHKEGIHVDILPKFKEVVKKIGFINVNTDIDGKIRKIMPAIYDGKEPIFYMGFLAALDYLNISEESVDIILGKKIILDNYCEIPLTESSEMIVNFPGRWEETFKHISYLDIIQSYFGPMQGQSPNLDLSILKDKVCLIGLTAAGTHDQSPTTIQARYPGVGVHASIFNSIIQKSFVKRAGRVLNLCILIILAMMVIYIGKKLNPIVSFFTLSGAMFLFNIAAFILFLTLNYWIDVVYPNTILFLIYLAITFNYYIEEKTKRELIEKELDIARKIQQSFLPQDYAKDKGVEISFRMDTAKHVGGDLYDFVDLDEGIGMLIGDVSGKGFPAALYMAKAVSEFKLYAKGNMSPAEVITKLNNQLADEEAGSLFVTLMYLIYNNKTNEMRLTSAGHGLLLIASHTGEVKYYETGDGMPAGIMPSEYEDIKITMHSGDTLVLFTDGISEARTKKGDEYSEEKIKKKLKIMHQESAEQILKNYFKDLDQFTIGAKQHDDMTLIVIKIK